MSNLFEKLRMRLYFFFVILGVHCKINKLKSDNIKEIKLMCFSRTPSFLKHWAFRHSTPKICNSEIIE